MMNRLFVSLDISSHVQDELIAIRDKIYGHDEKIKWEAKQKLHLTLKFLGDVEESKNDIIIDLMEDISSHHQKLDLSFAMFGTFARDKKPKILWVALNDSKPLIELQKNIENGFEKIGFTKENRKFKPHITILRLKGNEDLNKIEKFNEFKIPGINFTADGLSLMKSKLTPQGSIYTRMQSFKMN